MGSIMEVEPKQTKIPLRVLDVLDVGAMRIDLVSESMEALRIPETGDLRSDAEQILMFFWSRTRPENRLVCTTCRLVTDDDENTDMCPCCGGDDGEEFVAVYGKGPWGPERAPATAQESVAMDAAGETNGSNGVVKESGKAISVTPGDKTLDAVVEEVFELKKQGAVNSWMLGRKLAEIYDKKLWKLRTETDAKGKPKAKWASFEAFVTYELHISLKHGYQLIDVGKNFTSDEVAQFGTSKLGILLSLPAGPAREHMTQEMQAGASKRDLEKKAQELRQDNPKPVRSKDRKNQAKALAKKATEKRDKSAKRITIAMVKGTHTVGLFVPAAGKDPKTSSDWDALRIAKKSADFPIGRFELTNEATMFFKLVANPSTGQLQLKIKITRDS